MPQTGSMVLDKVAVSMLISSSFRTGEAYLFHAIVKLVQVMPYALTHLRASALTSALWQPSWHGAAILFQ